VDQLCATIPRRAAAVGTASAILLVAVYLIAVWTHAGQRLEDAVLRAAALATDGWQPTAATRLLGTVTTASLLGAAILVLTIAMLRRQAYLGFLAVGLIAASVVTTQILQAVVSRPLLLEAGRRREDQSFPSGHTAVAMSVMIALLMVVPQRFRWPAMILIGPWSIGMGVATVTAGWHRPSDTVGSDLIVLAYACLALVLLARQGAVRQTESRTPQTVLVGLSSAAMLVAVGIGVFAAGRSGFALSRAMVFGAAVGVALTMLALLRGVELGRAEGQPPPLQPGP